MSDQFTVRFQTIVYRFDCKLQRIRCVGWHDLMAVTDMLPNIAAVYVKFAAYSLHAAGICRKINRVEQYKMT